MSPSSPRTPQHPRRWEELTSYPVVGLWDQRCPHCPVVRIYSNKEDRAAWARACLLFITAVAQSRGEG